MMMGWGMGFGLMGVLMIVFWVGLILLVVLSSTVALRWRPDGEAPKSQGRQARGDSRPALRQG